MAMNDEQRPADVLVIFGITGDLAKVMTFRSLYRLEMRKLLDCPIVGVAVNDWTVEKLREHARECIEGTGEQLDQTVFDRLAERFSYVSGDFSDAATYGRVADGDQGQGDARLLPGDPAVPVRHGREGTDRRGTDEGRRARRRREAVRARSGLGPCARRRAALVHRRVAALPDRPLPGEDGPGRDPPPPVHELDARAGLEQELPRVRPDHDGRGLRRRGPRPLLRPGRCAPRRRGEPPDAGRRGVRDGGAGPRRSQDAEGRAGRPVPCGRRGRPRELRARPVRRLPVDRRRGTGLDDRDVRRPPLGHRELALGRRAVLHPDRQAAAGHADRAPPRVPAPAEARLRADAATPSRTSWWSSSIPPRGSAS